MITIVARLRRFVWFMSAMIGFIRKRSSCMAFYWWKCFCYLPPLHLFYFCWWRKKTWWLLWCTISEWRATGLLFFAPTTILPRELACYWRWWLCVFQSQRLIRTCFRAQMSSIWCFYSTKSLIFRDWIFQWRFSDHWTFVVCFDGSLFVGQSSMSPSYDYCSPLFAIARLE